MANPLDTMVLHEFCFSQNCFRSAQQSIFNSYNIILWSILLRSSAGNKFWHFSTCWSISALLIICLYTLKVALCQLWALLTWIRSYSTLYFSLVQAPDSQYLENFKPRQHHCNFSKWENRTILSSTVRDLFYKSVSQASCLSVNWFQIGSLHRSCNLLHVSSSWLAIK